MPVINRRDLNWLLRKFHLYLALGLGLVLVPIALTGSALVWRDQLDRLIMPSLYRVTGSAATLPVNAYLDSAAGVLGRDQRVAEIVFPEAPGWPVKIYSRGVTPDGRPSGGQIVYLDPPTAHVLGVTGISDSLTGKLHNFHHMLSAPQIHGRQIVGWFGIALFILSLTGIYLWWPMKGPVWRALRWRRSGSAATNLHHLIGFWTSIPMSIVALSGIYLSFPDTAFRLTAGLASTSGPMTHGFGAIPAELSSSTTGAVLKDVSALAPNALVRSVTLPTLEKHSHAGHTINSQGPWIVRVETPEGSRVEYRVDDASDSIMVADAKPAGDRLAEFITTLHEGRVFGPTWAIASIAAGLAPAVLLLTGLLMWLRQKRRLPGLKV